MVEYSSILHLLNLFPVESNCCALFQPKDRCVQVVSGFGCNFYYKFTYKFYVVHEIRMVDEYRLRNVFHSVFEMASVGYEMTQVHFGLLPYKIYYFFSRIQCNSIFNIILTRIMVHSASIHRIRVSVDICSDTSKDSTDLLWRNNKKPMLKLFIEYLFCDCNIIIYVCCHGNIIVSLYIIFLMLFACIIYISPII